MRYYLRILLSLLLAFFALGVFLLVRSVELPATGQFVLITGGIASIFAGIGLSLLTLYQIVQVSKEKAVAERKTEKLTDEEIVRRLEYVLSDVKPDYIESKLVHAAGSIATYLKKRGEARGEITEAGLYSTYEIWARGLKREVDSVLKKYPQLIGRSYVLNLISKMDTYALADFLEEFGSLYESDRILGMEFAPKKYLKSLASIVSK